MWPRWPRKFPQHSGCISHDRAFSLERDWGQERCWCGLACPWRPLYLLLLGLERQEGFELRGKMGKSYASVLIGSLRFQASAFKREVTFPDAGCWGLMLKISCFFLMCLHLGDTWFAKKTLSSSKIALPYYTQNLYRSWVITCSCHRMQRTFHNRKPQRLILWVSVEKSRESFGRGKKNWSSTLILAWSCGWKVKTKTYSLTLYSKFISRDCIRLSDLVGQGTKAGGPLSLFCGEVAGFRNKDLCLVCNFLRRSLQCRQGLHHPAGLEGERICGHSFPKPSKWGPRKKRVQRPINPLRKSWKPLWWKGTFFLKGREICQWNWAWKIWEGLGHSSPWWR